MRPRTLAAPVLVLGLGLALTVPRSADAHFVLQDPPSARSQDTLGSPQKLGPCGDEAGGTPTGIVTAYQSGTTMTITIDEKIYHPGHYRIALAVNDRSELPPEPLVTPDTTACGTVPIQSPPVFPVLADGVLAHTAPFTEPQTISVQLPQNVTCSHCTLQVLEFMSNHGLNMPGGCYYHHCATINVVAPDGGTPNPDGTTNMPSKTGCGCSSVEVASLGVAFLFLARRRRKPQIPRS